MGERHDPYGAAVGLAPDEPATLAVIPRKNMMITKRGCFMVIRSTGYAVSIATGKSRKSEAA
jgi:hypothetical protein